jgi:hypothetical protein
MTNNIQIIRRIADKVARGEDDFGRVAIKEWGKYVLLNYTAEAQYGGDFTDTEKACRGLVIRRDGKVMALPMPKFFNLGEPQCPPLPNEPYTVWEKIDGSLGIFWYDGATWHCNTRGSFRNEYTELAQYYWNRYYINCGWMHRWTVMCEICVDDDEMPRAVYKPEGLYLLAIRDRETGQDAPIWSVGTMPSAMQFDTTIDELIDAQEIMEGTEGWVVRFDSGFRVKVKTAWYLRLFRAIQQLTPKHIRELMLDSSKDWISDFPDDLRPQAIEIQAQIQEQFHLELDRACAAYSELANIELRKDFAFAVMKDYKDISRWLFKMRDGKFEPLELLRKMELSDAHKL